MPITAAQAAQARLAHINSVSALYTHLNRDGARVTREAVLRYQNAWNGRWRTLQEALALQGQHALANTLRELAPDGRWGTNTAYTTAIWISPSPPPASAASFPAWWRANGATISGRVAEIRRIDEAAIGREASPPPPVPPPPYVPQSEMEDRLIEPTGSTIEEDAARVSRSGAVSRTSMVPVLGGLVVLGGLWYLSRTEGGMGVLDFNGGDLAASGDEDCGCGG